MWVILLVISGLLTLAFLVLTIIKLIKKESTILHPKEILEAKKLKKADKEAKKQLKSDNMNGLPEEDDDEKLSFEDSDTEFEDFVKEHSPQKKFFTIVMLVKFCLLCGMIGIISAFDANFVGFFEKYILISCKFTYMNQVLLEGDERNTKIKFLGISVLENKTKTLLEWYANTTAD